jgi:NADH-quinone oxidoreductase subunit K
MSIGHYLVLSGLLFCVGAAGVFLRRNLITLLLSVEIMLNAVNLAFVAFSRTQGIDGQVFVFFVMTVAAAEAAVGLALVIAIFRHLESVDMKNFNLLRW